MPPADIHERITNDFAYHPPSTPAVVAAHERVRELLGDVAHALVDITPAGREQSLMLTSLEHAMYEANAAIARHQVD